MKTLLTAIALATVTATSAMAFNTSDNLPGDIISAAEEVVFSKETRAHYAQTY